MSKSAKVCFGYVTALPGLRPLARVLDNRRGVTALEYGLIAAVTAVGIIAGLAIIAPKLAKVFTDIGAAI